LLGPVITIASSLLIFSGALQFALLGLVGAGAGLPALLATAVILNLRHLVMGAVLRNRLDSSPLARAGLAWFLVDETFGFAIAACRDAGHTLFTSGVMCYLAWQVGTWLGLFGASVPGLDGLATAIFPVLFIGLASLAATSGGVLVRIVAAGLLTFALSTLVPDLRAVAPIVSAISVALPESRR
jgi:predicted branched-subunit amino acid permease